MPAEGIELGEYLTEAVTRFGYAAVFLGVFAESAGVPVPGETALLVAGFLASRGMLKLPIVMAVAMLATFAGDNLGYWLGRRYGRGLLESHGRHVGLTPERLARVDRFFARHGPKTVLVARFVTGLRVVAAIAAGASGMRWRTFVPYNLGGAVPWAIAVSLAGFAFAESWRKVERWTGRGGLIALALLGVAGGLVVLWRRRSARSSR
jgi:membrane protein DedA with SNARE-associated domain